MNFKIDELMDVIALCEAGNEPVAVLINTSNEIVRHSNIDRPVGTTCKNVDVELSHTWSVPKRDGRDKPGDDAPKVLTPGLTPGSLRARGRPSRTEGFWRPGGRRFL